MHFEHEVFLVMFRSIRNKVATNNVEVGSVFPWVGGFFGRMRICSLVRGVKSSTVSLTIMIL